MDSFYLRTKSYTITEDGFMHNHQSALDNQREDDAIRDLEDAGIYPDPENDTIFRKLYEEEYEAIYLEIANESDVTESGEDWVTPTVEDREIMHKIATERAKKKFEELPNPDDKHYPMENDYDF